MRHHRRAPAVGLAAGLILVTFATAATPASAQFRIRPGTCPETRAFIIPEMKTRPADGAAYRQQRTYARMKVDRLIRSFGGPRRARAVAEATRENARRRLAAAEHGTARRYWHDTILRAEALILILNCRREPGA